MCTNAPPKDPDEQVIPKSLEHVIKLKEAAKISDNQKRKHKKKKNSLICVGLQESKPNPHPKARPEKVVPVFQQKVGESGQQFWHRVNKDTHAFIKETEFEQKYGVQVERDSETGLIQGLTKRKIDKDDIVNLRGKHKNIKKKKKTTTVADTKKTLTKSEKRKQKLRLKKEKKLERREENEDEFKTLQDKVAFGEVAHEPPRLKIKKMIIDEGRKPKDLLLSSMFGGKNVSSASKAIDRTGKRKKLPAAERRKLEKQQSDIIATYRQLRSQRSTNKKF